MMFPWQKPTAREVSDALDTEKYDRIAADIDRRFSIGSGPVKVVFHGNMLAENAPAEETPQSKAGRKISVEAIGIGAVRKRELNECDECEGGKMRSKGKGRLRCSKCRRTVKKEDPNGL